MPALPSPLNLASCLLFVGFLATGLLAIARRPGSGKRALNLFLLWAVGSSLFAGLSQHDLWPFAAWPIKALIPAPSAALHRIVCVDARGQEHRVDYRAWQPFGVDELHPWMIFRFSDLPPEGQDQAAAYLIELAERGRRRARDGRGVGYFDRWLGPATAPYFMLHPRLWRTPADVPPEPFVGLRVYWEGWSLAERRRDAGAVERELLYEYPRR